MAVSIADIKKLREATKAGMSDCKKALEEANGDFDAAVDIIRKKGLLVASKRADREAKEGCVLGKIVGKNGAIVSLNCETDFVAKNEGFIALTTKILDLALEKGAKNMDELLALELEGRSVANHVSEQTGIIGEKIEIGYYNLISGEDMVAYVHPGNKLVSVVAFNKAADVQVKKDIAMQVAAMAPVALDKNDVPAETVAHELEIGKEKAREEGKPEAMLEKIAMGRLNKFYQEYTLLNQVFEKDGKMSVREYMKSADKDLTATGFLRFTLND